MHDASRVRSYDPEPITAETWQPPKRATQDLTMQVQLDDGRWHRRIPGVSGTVVACGKPILLPGGQSIRHESYDGQLCRDGCFSAFELELGRVNQAKERP